MTTNFEMEDSDVLESREDLGEWRHIVGEVVMCWEKMRLMEIYWGIRTFVDLDPRK